jgi:hypothetical protein
VPLDQGTEPPTDHGVSPPDVAHGTDVAHPGATGLHEHGVHGQGVQDQKEGHVGGTHVPESTLPQHPTGQGEQTPHAEGAHAPHDKTGHPERALGGHPPQSPERGAQAAAHAASAADRAVHEAHGAGQAGHGDHAEHPAPGMTGHGERPTGHASHVIPESKDDAYDAMVGLPPEPEHSVAPAGDDHHDSHPSEHAGGAGESRGPIAAAGAAVLGGLASIGALLRRKRGS